MLDWTQNQPEASTPVIEPEPENIQCEYCRKASPSSSNFCDQCGFPFVSSDAQRTNFISQMRSRIIDLKHEQKQVQSARVAMFVLAGLCFILVPFSENLSPFNPGGFAAVLVVLSGMWGGLAFWSYRQDFEAVFTGTVMFLTLQMIAFAVNPVSLVQGYLLKYPLIYFMIRGTIGAFRTRKLRAKIILPVQV